METEAPPTAAEYQISQILESYRNPQEYLKLRSQLGGWEVVESDFFPNSLRIVTTRGERKLKRRDSISVHYDPVRGRFYKIAEIPKRMVKLAKSFAAGRLR